ncbi:colony stimulating factor 3 (granulocyte) a [Hoplias malabaricus]|uniref:colony stimulating factor 3 (granulocyte) a n=1 Tax=Hoplias malabaricus TaxID=27720 RepID=UPI00346186D2
MHLFLGLPMALCALSLVSAAPLLELLKDMQDPAFQNAVENGQSLINRILISIPAVHKSWIQSESLSFDSSDSGKLEYLKGVINLPAAPVLKTLSDDTLGACLSQIAEGLKLHKTLLTVVSDLRTTKSEKVNLLLHDIRDLLPQIHKMQKLIKVANVPEEEAVSKSHLQADLKSRVTDEYLSQVAAHLTLLQLQKFGQDVSRSLRSMVTSTADSVSQTTGGTP